MAIAYLVLFEGGIMISGLLVSDLELDEGRLAGTILQLAGSSLAACSEQCSYLPPAGLQTA